jgi:hypothetical protein
MNNIENKICECNHDLIECVDNDDILICNFCGIKYCKRCKLNSDKINIYRSKKDYYNYSDNYSDNYKCEICNDN